VHDTIILSDSMRVFTFDQMYRVLFITLALKQTYE
jgi:hypothetical protein